MIDWTSTDRLQKNQGFQTWQNTFPLNITI